jgi:hypothetical protein
MRLRYWLLALRLAWARPHELPALLRLIEKTSGGRHAEDRHGKLPLRCAAERWRAFHRKHARLRVVSARANLSTLRRRAQHESRLKPRNSTSSATFGRFPFHSAKKRL